MFNNCYSLSSLPDISNLNTNNVIYMSRMFYNCISLFYYLIYQNGILIMFKIWVWCFLIVDHYHHYLIYQNGIQIMLETWVECFIIAFYYYIYQIYKSIITNIFMIIITINYNDCNYLIKRFQHFENWSKNYLIIK